MDNRRQVLQSIGLALTGAMPTQLPASPHDVTLVSDISVEMTDDAIMLVVEYSTIRNGAVVSQRTDKKLIVNVVDF